MDAVAKDEAPSSKLDVNTQSAVFEDADHDLIEDLSVSADLAESNDAEHLKPVASGSGGGIFNHLLDVDKDGPDDYTEEITAADGSHYTKTVHKGAGFEQIEIHSDQPLNIGDVIGQLM